MINDLLDAAHSEYLHDMPSGDPSSIYTRRILREKFLSIIDRNLTKRATDSLEAGTKSAVKRVRKPKVIRPAKSG